MKRCLSCNNCFSSETTICPKCGWKPKINNGLTIYAPEIQESEKGFKDKYFEDLIVLENHNFWFSTRNKLIIWALKKYCPTFNSLLEVGCGTGFVLSGIKNIYSDRSIFGSDPSIVGLSYAKSREPNLLFMQMDACNIPFIDEYDVIGSFDVLEHIKEDELALRQMHDALTFGGHLFITVPQHSWLWSPIDEYSCHERRYSALEIESKIKKAKFRIIRSTSFVTTLLPAMILSRLIKSRNRLKFNPKAELEINSAVNSFLEICLHIELIGIRLGMCYPFGGSRLIIAEKITR